MGDKFCLHGLNSIYLRKYGWIRADARGNNASVSASFNPPEESLAFSAAAAGEADFPEVWADPLPIVTKFLSSYADREKSLPNLPDIPIF